MQANMRQASDIQIAPRTAPGNPENQRPAAAKRSTFF